MKWEYKSIIAQGRKLMFEEFVKQLNEQGKLGWEVCGISIAPSAAVAIMKRQVTGP